MNKSTNKRCYMGEEHFIPISNIRADVSNKDSFLIESPFFQQGRLRFRSVSPLPMMRRGCFAFLITDAASCTAEVSAILTGGGMQHSTYLEIKMSVN